MKRVGVLVLMMAVAVVGVWAQDWQNDAAFGTVELSAGFSPDPYVVELYAGGSVDLGRSSKIGGVSASGFVAASPDVDLYYDAGSWDLFIYVDGGSTDTVLLVRDPDGYWHFNDDFDGQDPGILIESPSGGLYSVWVGTFRSGSSAQVDLMFSER